jgi:hypothetical protein
MHHFFQKNSRSALAEDRESKVAGEVISPTLAIIFSLVFCNQSAEDTDQIAMNKTDSLPVLCYRLRARHGRALDIESPFFRIFLFAGRPFCPFGIFLVLFLKRREGHKSRYLFFMGPNLTKLNQAPGLKPGLYIMNTASKLGPHTQTDRGTCPGVGL